MDDKTRSVGHLALLDMPGLELPAEMDSLEGCKFFEGHAIGASGEWLEAKTKFSYCVHMILEHELWKHYKDADGNRLYRRQNDYLAELDKRCARAVSTMKQDHSALKMAQYLGITGINVLAEIGIDVINEVFLAVHTERGTGKPIHLRQGKLPDGTNLDDYLAEAIITLANDRKLPRNDIDDLIEADNLRASDYSAKRDRLLRPGVPMIRFERVENGAIWVYENYVDSMLTFYSGSIIMVEDKNGAVSLTLTADEGMKKVPKEVVGYVLDKLRLSYWLE